MSAVTARRDAEVTRLRAETIRKAAAMVPEWRPWMRQWAIDTDWGTRESRTARLERLRRSAS